MNVPTRMLGIATTIFWIILAGFIAFAAYSLKDLNFGVGEPQFAASFNHDLVVRLPLFIDNRGYYSLEGFNLTTVFSDENGTEISRASTFVAVIPHGENTTILHNVTLNMDRMAQRLSQYLFEDSEFMCAVKAGVDFAEILPTTLATNLTFPWGAPFYNFRLGQPQLSVATLSSITGKVPLTFDNHAAFDVTGNVRVKIFNANNMLLAEAQTDINAAKQSGFRGDLTFTVPAASAVSTASLQGHFEVYFSTPMFEYGPLVILYG